MVKTDHMKYLLFTLLILLQATDALSVTITAQASRNPVAIDETFELIFDAESSPDGEPDFSPLKNNFEIFSRIQSQSIKMINGDYSTTTRWRLSVMAKRTGQLTIPAISFGSDHSQATSVQIQKAANSKSAANNAEIFMEVTVEPKTAYVQQQLLFHVRIFRAVNITDATLSAPEFSDPDIIVEQIDDEQNYETQRNGNRYLVSQIDYLAFPQASGTLTLDPITFQARVMQSNHQRYGMFGQAGPTKRIRSKAVTVEIKPVPKSAAQPWLPLTNLQLSSSWPKANPEFRVGEPVTRTLAIIADGATAAQLPEIHAEAPAGFKQYPDQPMLQNQKDESGVTSIRQEKIALVPTKEGMHILPAIKITWWNIKTNKKEVAYIAEEHIQVLPAIDAHSTIEPSISTANNPISHTTKLLPSPTEHKSQVKPDNGIYSWLSLFFAFGWLSTATAWWWIRQQQRQVKSNASDNIHISKEKSRNKILAELKQACQVNDSHAVRVALLYWSKTVWKSNPPKGLAEMAFYFDKATAENLLALNQTLYSKENSSWDGEILWNAVKNYKYDVNMQKHPAEKIESLYL